jgi:RimJ/RimL family protein N-acetyltransferase
LNHQYLFTSERLGFRNWQAADLEPMTAINTDPEVMAYFPAPYDREQTAAFISRMQQLYTDKGYCYFAVEILNEHRFIGFTGLAWQTYEAPFTPCVDIGWRLRRTAWGHGYAAEGAARCLQYAFKELQIGEVNAVAPLANTRSVRVMKQIGMNPLLHFKHKALSAIRLWKIVYAIAQRNPNGLSGAKVHNAKTDQHQ